MRFACELPEVVLLVAAVTIELFRDEPADPYEGPRVIYEKAADALLAVLFEDDEELSEEVADLARRVLERLQFRATGHIRARFRIFDDHGGLLITVI